MSGNGSTAGTRVELFARSSLPEVASRRRDEVAGRLKQLVEDGHVDDVAIRTWEKKVPLSSDHDELTEYERFRDWAEETGVSLDPFFDTRSCYSMETGERGEWLVLPALCLAVYRDGDLDAVYPHSTNDGSRSVLDCLHAIEAAPGRVTEPLESEGTEQLDLAEVSD
ncbi:HTH domain-containing protein [Halorientalis pallida]|uniref:HTH domain-containing protein n=1 Tax=Halorientalis pallida TaxID=2479928 RepID=UPI003C6F5B18